MQGICQYEAHEFTTDEAATEALSADFSLRAKQGMWADRIVVV